MRAEQAGFEFAAISDDFFPRLDEQGHAPFAWTVLGAAAQVTSHIGPMTAVTCPIMRYHPAYRRERRRDAGVAERRDRFVFGLGAGERLNEHVIGEGWPGLGERHERLSEAYDMIRCGLDSGPADELPRQLFQPRQCQAEPDLLRPVPIARRRSSAAPADLKPRASPAARRMG